MAYALKRYTINGTKGTTWTLDNLKSEIVYIVFTQLQIVSLIENMEF